MCFIETIGTHWRHSVRSCHISALSTPNTCHGIKLYRCQLIQSVAPPSITVHQHSSPNEYYYCNLSSFVSSNEKRKYFPMPGSVSSSACRFTWLTHVLPNHRSKAPSSRGCGRGGGGRNTNGGIQRVTGLIPNSIVFRRVTTGCPGFAIIMGRGCDDPTVGTVRQEFDVFNVVISKQAGQISGFAGPNHL